MGLRIEALPIGEGGSFVLADGTNKRGPGGKLAVDNMPHGLFRIRYEAQIPRVQHLEAESEEFQAEPSGNYLQSGDWPLSVEYEFLTPEECFLFMGLMQWKLPVLCNLLLTYGSASITLPKVPLRPVEVQPIGEVSCRLDLTVRFGLVTNPFPIAH